MEELLRQISQMKQADAALRASASSVHTLIARRVFGQGRDADDGKILGGSYSTKPMYVSISRMAKKIPGKGKTGRTKKKNGDLYKSRYFEQGYKEFREKTGRGQQGQQSAVVNLRYTGQMERDWKFAPDGGNYVSGFDNPINGAKAERQEQRNRGAIFAPTDDELKKMIEVFEFELNKIV